MPKHYNHFIKIENAKRELFKEELYPKDIRALTKNEVDSIKKSMECSLSPENLHMDGEATELEVESTMEHMYMLCREISCNTEFEFSIDDLDY